LDLELDLVTGRIPGLPNLHSHAFQRAMAGLTERRGSEADSFWTWREQMYRFVERLGPDDLEAIAAHAYMEMLEAGFTWVAEFHYLHHQPDGRPYANIAEMSERIVAAASQTGIGLTLLPVFYCQGGFGGKPPSDAQRRFLNDRESYARLMETRVPGGRIGIAPHSLRALGLDDLKWAAETWHGQPAHIHVSEQTREVEDCLAVHGRRPIDRLMDTAPVDEHWCLVHATHADEGERARIAKAKAVVGLCPITEANLGDGLFDVPDFLAQGGRFGVGSDSNVRISAADELRTLEYGQRLIHRQRNVLGDASRSTGRRLYDAALAGGAQAVGAADDAVVTRDTANHRGDAALDHWLFAADNAAIVSVDRGDARLVDHGRHRDRDRITARYRKTLARLLG
jgi:formiminoglutamate deiminase